MFILGLAALGAATIATAQDRAPPFATFDLAGPRS
jgi:hypothetical protein